MATKKNKVKKRTINHHQPQMKLVTSETCVACKTPCNRGMDYVEKMSEPGTVGLGVPCMLTLK